MTNIGINQVGVCKYQQGTPRGGLLPKKYSGTWGNRGQGNELQSALENVLSQTGDMIINSGDYIEQGLAYLGGLLPGGLSAEEALQSERNKQAAMREGKDGFVNAFGKYEYFPITGVAPDVSIAKMPGWQLKGLMRGSQLEKQLSKAGTININGLQAYLNKASKLEQDVIGRILSTKFAEQKNIDYNALRKAVSDELITYSRKPQTEYSTYGMDRIGFENKKTPDGAGGIVDYVPGVKTQTFTFESPRIPRGNDSHYDITTLGHSRTFTIPDEPDILYVMESQSDWGQQTKDLTPRFVYKRDINGNTNIIFDETGRFHYTENGKGMPYSEFMDLSKPNDQFPFHIAKTQFYENYPMAQVNHLHTNYLQRQLQENMKYAAEQGQKRMRYPTPDTAAKIEEYKKTYPEPEYSMLKQKNEAYQKAFENGTIPYDRYLELSDGILKRLREIQGQGQSYSPEHQTILKKYSDFPKMFNKLFKGQEVRTVTDPKGNTWYEVDIPENFLQSEWQFRKGGVLGLNKIIGL